MTVLSHAPLRGRVAAHAAPKPRLRPVELKTTNSFGKEETGYEKKKGDTGLLLHPSEVKLPDRRAQQAKSNCRWPGEIIVVDREI